MDRDGPDLEHVGYDMTATNHVGLRTTMNTRRNGSRRVCMSTIPMDG